MENKMKDKPAFKYRGRDASAVKERATQSGGAFDNYTDPRIPRFKVTDGENNIRIMPPTWEDTDQWGDSWGMEIFVHQQIGPDKSAYLCPNKMKGEDCPICDARQELTDDKSADEEAANALRPGKRILAYVIDRTDEKSGPQLWAMPWTVEREVSSRSLDKKTGEVILIDDPDEGFDISFRRTGTGLRTKYETVDVDRESSPISDNPKTQAKWLEFVQENPLPDILKFYDADYLEKVYNGKKVKPDADDQADSGDEPAKPGKSGRVARQGKAEPTSKVNKSPPISENALDVMDEDDMKEVITNYKLDIDPDDFPILRKLRAAVVKALDEAGKLENGDDPTPAAEPAKSAKAKKPEFEVVKQSTLDAMDDEELGKLNDDYGLDVDLDKCKSVRQMRLKVVEVLEARDLLEDDSADQEEEAAEDPPAKPGKSGRVARDAPVDPPAKSGSAAARESIDRLKNRHRKPE